MVQNQNVKCTLLILVRHENQLPCTITKQLKIGRPNPNMAKAHNTLNLNYSWSNPEIDLRPVS